MPGTLTLLVRTCELHRLHLVTYENGTKLQQKLVELRQQDLIPDQFLLLEHPPVITLGRAGDRSNLLASDEFLKTNHVRFFATSRGGDITYHGPGQLIGYPILDLGEGHRDVRKYVTKLEEVLIRTVADFGVTAERVEGRRGIWVGNDKIAAIGVHVARWVTSHGFALNVNTNLDHFRMINPCGLHGTGVTSIQRETGRTIPLPEVHDAVARHFAQVFERAILERPETIRLIKVMATDGDRVLLLHRRPERGNFWQPVTGAIEEGESALAAAAREVLEETGQVCEPEPIGLTQSFMIESHYLSSRHGSLVIASEVGFATRLDSAAEVRLDPEEHDAFAWCTFSEAFEKIRWTDDREALEQLEIRLNEGSVAAAPAPAAAPAKAVLDPLPAGQ